MTQHPYHETQGELFAVELESSGTTDPNTPRMVTAHFTEAEGGLFPEVVEQAPVVDLNQSAITATVRAEVAQRNRRRAQLGKHSPLQREDEAGGDYTRVKVGDYLPDFGPVTYNNYTDAQMYAHTLEKKRSAQGNR